MVKEVIKDIIFLGQKSEKATADDLSTAEDLLDTLKANEKICVGMAANMIGIKKCIIAFNNEGEYILMFNPEIIKFSDGYKTEEGCLSLTGTRETKRYRTIKVKYENSDFQIRIKTFKDFIAQIIQHEIDHCNGIII